MQAERQPGSSFKPFIYSAALEKGYTAASTVNDAPVAVPDTFTVDEGGTATALDSTEVTNAITVRLGTRCKSPSMARRSMAPVAVMICPARTFQSRWRGTEWSGA